MIISKLFFNSRIFARSNLPIYCFARQNNSKSLPLQNQILNQRSFSDFFNLFQNNKDKFDTDLFSFSSKSLNSFLLNYSQSIDFGNCRQILNSLQQINIANQQTKNLVNIFSIIRHIKMRGVNIYHHYGLINKIGTRVIEVIKEKKVTIKDLPELFICYFQFSFFKNDYFCKLLTDKIIYVIQENKKADTLNLNDNQLAYFLYCLSTREELSKNQIRIRSIFLQIINKNINNINLEDIVKIAINLNRMEIIDFRNYQISTFKMIINKIIENITSLQQKSIFDLIKSEHVSRYSGFIKIYDEIAQNIFSAIEADGSSQISSQAIIKALTYASRKMTLNKFAPELQNKFFVFLNLYAKGLLKQNQQMSTVLATRMQFFVKNNFIDSANRQKFHNFLISSKLVVTINLFYYLSIKNYNVAPFVQQMTRFNPQILKNVNLIKLIIPYNKIKDSSPVAAAQFKQIQEILALNYSKPENFVQFVKQFKNIKSQINLVFLHQIFQSHFSKLPNPFQQNQTDQVYRFSYLQYVFASYRSRDLTNFLTKYEQTITLKQFTRYLQIHLSQDLKAIQPQRQIIYILTRRHNQILESNNKKWIQLMFEFVGKYHRFILYKEIDYKTQYQLFKIMHLLIGKIKKIKEIKQGYNFAMVLQKYLSRKYKAYANQFNYRNLLRHTLNIIDQIQPKSRTMSVILQQGLRLSVLTPKILQKVHIDQNSFNFHNKMRINYIKDPKFLPKIDRLNHSTLKIVLSNRNFQQYISTNQKQILQLIISSNSFQTFEYLTYFNQNINTTTRNVLNQIINQSASKISNFQSMNLVGFFNNTINRNYMQSFKFQKITEQIMEYAKNKVDQLSIQTHLQFIKFICAQSSINTKEYYQTLVKYALSRDDFPDHLINSLFVRLASSYYLFNESQIKYVDRMVQKNTIQGLFFFLMIEPKMNETHKIQTVLKLCENLPKTLKNEQKTQGQQHEDNTIPKLYYQYLKLKYPQQTKTLQIDQKYLSKFKFAYHSKNIQYITNISQQIKLPLTTITTFGQQNILHRLKNVIFVNLSHRRIGSYYEHQFLKRAMPLIMNEPVTVICLANIFENSLIGYVNKLAPDLLTAENAKNLQEKIKNKKYEEIKPNQQQEHQQ